jgi:hypothetical protein
METSPLNVTIGRDLSANETNLRVTQPARHEGNRSAPPAQSPRLTLLCICHWPCRGGSGPSLLRRCGEGSRWTRGALGSSLPAAECRAKALFGGGKLARSGRALCNAGGEGIPHAQGWWQHGGRLPGRPRLAKWCARSGLDRAVALQFGYASGVRVCRSQVASSAPMCGAARPFDPSFVHGWSEIGQCGHGRCERLRTAALVFFAPTGARAVAAWV